MQEADHHIGHLHAGVVDVVLHVDFLPGGAQQADKRVAQNCVAQVADVRGLVGIDAGVLDQRVHACSRTRGPASVRGHPATPAARSSRALMYPAPATSKLAKPSSAPSAATISCAMIFGALRSLRASSKAMGVDSSPNFRSGGISSGMFSSSRSYFACKTRAKMLAEPFLQFQIHVELPQKSLIFKGDSNRAAHGHRRFDALAVSNLRWKSGLLIRSRMPVQSHRNARRSRL